MAHGIVRAGLWMLATVAASAQPCAISGRVVDDRGTGVPHAAVSAMRGDLAVMGVTAGASGEFCLSGLSTGAYRLRATTRSHPSSASPGCQTCCAPTTELQQARVTEFSVAPDRAAAKVTVAMRRVPAYCVRGEIRDSQGALLQRVFVGLESEVWMSGILTRDGRFLLTSIPDGTYTLAVTDQPQLGRVLARQEFRVSGRNRTVRVTVTPRSPSRP